MRGAGVIDREKAIANPDPSVVTDLSWDLVIYLSQHFEKYSGLMDDINKSWVNWNKFCLADDPFNEKLPNNYNETFDLFDKLMLIKIFKSEKLMFGFANYVEHHIGKYYLEIP